MWTSLAMILPALALALGVGWLLLDVAIEVAAALGAG